MKLTKLLSMLMYEVDEVDVYDKGMNLLYIFNPDKEKLEESISKFNISEVDDKRILEVIAK